MAKHLQVEEVCGEAGQISTGAELLKWTRHSLTNYIRKSKAKSRLNVEVCSEALLRRRCGVRR